MISQEVFLNGDIFSWEGMQPTGKPANFIVVSYLIYPIFAFMVKIGMPNIGSQNKTELYARMNIHMSINS